jgi:hypothetical protein
MPPVWVVLVTFGAMALAAGLLLTVRRGAPEGGYFEDGDRAAGVFGVLATGFSILLGLIVVIAFTSFDDSRRGAEAEAVAVQQAFQTSQLLPEAVRAPLGDGLVCYARYVVHEEWPALQDGTSKEINPWSVELFRTQRTIDPETAVEESSYDTWVERTTDRTEARQERIHGSEGVIPNSLWLVLVFITVIIFIFMLFFADRAERKVVQAMMIAATIGVITAMLLLIRFLDDPYRTSFGGLEPVAMERAATVLEEQRAILGLTGSLPCDAQGRQL